MLGVKNILPWSAIEGCCSSSLAVAAEVSSVLGEVIQSAGDWRIDATSRWPSSFRSRALSNGVLPEINQNLLKLIKIDQNDFVHELFLIGFCLKSIITGS